MRCLGDDTVLRFVQRQLANDEAARVDQHMAGCEACRTLVAEAAKYVFSSEQAAAPRGFDALQRGDTVGRYEVRELLGSGAMGVVYVANDPHLRRSVALKLLRPDRVEDAGRAQARLLREARAMARLSHPNVVSVYDAGAFEGGVFVAMELLETTLKHWLAERPRSPSEVLDVFTAAGRGLAAAHAAGLIHRDFKPENVLVGADGRVRVTDFGLARPLGGGGGGGEEPPPSSREEALAMLGETLVERTKTGALIGTPAYMAPEQFACSAVDARTDQFSFCVALYEALYGQRPYDATSLVDLAAEVRAGRVRVPPASSSVPSALAPVLVRGLAVNPDDRHPSMDALLIAIASAAAVQTSSPDAAPRAPAIRRWLSTAFALGALGIAIASAAVLRSRGRAPFVAPSDAASLPPASAPPLGTVAHDPTPPIPSGDSIAPATAAPSATAKSSAERATARPRAARPTATASPPLPRDDDAPIADPWKR